MSDPRAPRTAGIQFSTSAPNALGKGIQAHNAAATARRAKAAGGSDGDHDHADGGEHMHDHLESRITDHEGRIADLEGQSGHHGDGST